MHRITSRHNPLVARFRAAASGEDPALLLLDGDHLVGEALAGGATIRCVAIAADASGTDRMLNLMARLPRGVDVVTASAPVMAALSPVRSASRVVALAERASLPGAGPAALYSAAGALVVLACDVQDPGNLGAIVRVAEAGGATGCVAAGASADPFGWKALRGSMGSALRLPVARVRDVGEAARDARRYGCRVFASVPRGGASPFDADLTAKVAVLIGGEGQGLPVDVVGLADSRITIPMQPPVDSLNAAVAAALIVYEARRQRTGGRPGKQR